MKVVLGFVQLPWNTLPVEQPDGHWAFRKGEATPAECWASVQPDGSIKWKPEDYPLGGYELATWTDLGWRFDLGANWPSYLQPGVDHP